MSLFGNLPGASQPQSTSLFGSTNNQQSTGTSSVFGNNSNNQQSSSLFGNTNNNQQSTGTSSGFGGAQQQQPQQSTSLFGNLNTQRPQQQQAGTSSLSGATTANNNTQTQPNNPQPQSLQPLPASAPQDLAAQSLSARGIHAQPNEKRTFEQVQTLVRKWDPHSQDTVLQSYLYNAVGSAYAPFYYRNVDEGEKEWEEALRKKPAPVKGEGGGEEVSFVPVLVRGFRALGERVEFQARTVNEMRGRLHEMNNSLNAIITRHQQSLTLRLANTHRAHTALAQRTLRLAVKLQVLRSRGFALSPAEETLRKSLLALEKQTFDGAFVAREEEIWARMVQLRERARWLEEEGKRISVGSDGERTGGDTDGKGGVPEEVVVQTKRILRDYDGQIRHLGRELEEVTKEFEEWEGQK